MQKYCVRHPLHPGGEGRQLETSRPVLPSDAIEASYDDTFFSPHFSIFVSELDFLGGKNEVELVA